MLAAASGLLLTFAQQALGQLCAEGPGSQGQRARQIKHAGLGILRAVLHNKSREDETEGLNAAHQTDLHFSKHIIILQHLGALRQHTWLSKLHMGWHCHCGNMEKVCRGATRAWRQGSDRTMQATSLYRRETTWVIV
eukprot:scaffold81268_cov21-Tisochrysis_lutea.AAC.1